MKFRKLGLVYCPDGSDPLRRRYAILPTPMLLEDGNIRVFFASTDDDNVGRAFFVDLDRADPLRIIRRVEQPVLDAGLGEAFDRYGVNPISIVRNGAELRLYYAGYQRPGAEVPYMLLTGLAISRDGGERFQRAQDTPVLPPIASERYFRTAAHVHRSGDRWRMWYIGGNRWTEHAGKKLPIYGLRDVESSDGISWSAPRTVLEPDETQDQIGFGRPYVVAGTDGYRMFLSVRTWSGYSISHARSSDGFAWTDWQHDVIPLSYEGWDSQMCSYAAPVFCDGREYVFYNGNGFGRTGFGVAIREA